MDQMSRIFEQTTLSIEQNINQIQNLNEKMQSQLRLNLRQIPQVLVKQQLTDHQMLVQQKQLTIQLVEQMMNETHAQQMFLQETIQEIQTTVNNIQNAYQMAAKNNMMQLPQSSIATDVSLEHYSQVCETLSGNIEKKLLIQNQKAHLIRQSIENIAQDFQIVQQNEFKQKQTPYNYDKKQMQNEWNNKSNKQQELTKKKQNQTPSKLKDLYNFMSSFSSS